MSILRWPDSSGSATRSQMHAVYAELDALLAERVTLQLSTLTAGDLTVPVPGRAPALSELAKRIYAADYLILTDSAAATDAQWVLLADYFIARGLTTSPIVTLKD